MESADGLAERLLRHVGLAQHEQVVQSADGLAERLLRLAWFSSNTDT